MTPTDQTLLHASLLQTLRASGDLGRTAELLRNDALIAGFDLSLPALRVELRTLADKGWIAEIPQPLGSTRYRITALGRSILEEQRL